MSYEFYKVLHMAGVMVLLLSLGAIAAVRVAASKEASAKLYKQFGMLHGISLTVILVAGFGLLARLGLTDSFPSWIYGKLGIWLVAGGIFTFIKKGKMSLMANLTVVLILGVVASILAVVKP